MTNRVVYPEAALWGATPSLMDKKGAAAREIAAIADEVKQICDSMAPGQTGSKRMNKKKFPKAVLRTADQMREAGARDRGPNAGRVDNVIEMVPKSEPGPSREYRGQRRLRRPIPAAALRRRQAVAIVERYANYSAIGGAIPIPLANAAAITALLVRMVKSLSELYGVPFERNRTRSIVIALMGGALPTGFATIATSTITLFVPGLNLWVLPSRR